MNLFDILGPVMVGPSSSHTAGAVRIGRMARHLLGEPVSEADIMLYGSFWLTHKGHGTDRAIVAGLLDYNVDDTRLRDSFRHAMDAGMRFRFAEASLKQAHPNTVLLRLTGVTGKQLRMQAASVGGGNIRVVELNGVAVSFTGTQNTLIIPHLDQPGMIAAVTAVMAEYTLNIGSMQVFRDRVGGTATMIIETDSTPNDELLARLKTLAGIEDVIFVSREQ